MRFVTNEGDRFASIKVKRYSLPAGKKKHVATCLLAVKASYPCAFFKLSMALIATTPVRLGKRVWRLWIGDDDQCNNDEREATKQAKDELTGYGSSYDSFFFNRGDCQGAQVLIVSRRKLHSCPPAGPTSLARLTVDENMQYSLQVLLHTIESGEVESVDHFMKLCDKIRVSFRIFVKGGQKQRLPI